jgi:LmbE family N-acetylglucosaminyl deacetylase
MKTLVIVAHMDDEAISCGGLILNRAKEFGSDVGVIALFGRKYNYGKGDQYEAEQADQFARSCRLLGARSHYCYKFEEGEPQKIGYYNLLERLEGEFSMHQPEEVVVPSERDLNQDHRWLSDVCRIALRPANLDRTKRILAWHGVDGTVQSANWFESLSEEDLELKLKAVDGYTREKRSKPHPRCPENIVAMHRVVGSKCGWTYAEPYTLIMQRRG